MSTGLTGRFTRQQRLIQASEFKNVFANPCVKLGDANMLLLGIKNNHQTARLGLAVAKKQLKHAVSRNRFKRLTRESFRHHLNIIKNLEIVPLLRRTPRQYIVDALLRAGKRVFLPSSVNVHI